MSVYRGVAMEEKMTKKRFLMGILVILLVFGMSIAGCNKPNIVGTWELSHSNVRDIAANTVEFRNNGTGTMGMGAIREDFNWSINGNELLLNSGLLTTAYNITEFSDSRVSIEANIPGLGVYRSTYTRR